MCVYFSDCPDSLWNLLHRFIYDWVTSWCSANWSLVCFVYLTFFCDYVVLHFSSSLRLFQIKENKVPVCIEVCGLQKKKKKKKGCNISNPVSKICEVILSQARKGQGSAPSHAVTAAPFWMQSQACCRGEESLWGSATACKTPISSAGVCRGYLERVSRKGRDCLTEELLWGYAEEGLCPSPRDYYPQSQTTVFFLCAGWAQSELTAFLHSVALPVSALLGAAVSAVIQCQPEPWSRAYFVTLVRCRPVGGKERVQESWNHHQCCLSWNRILWTCNEVIFFLIKKGHIFLGILKGTFTYAVRSFLSHSLTCLQPSFISSPVVFRKLSGIT